MPKEPIKQQVVKKVKEVIDYLRNEFPGTPEATLHT